eukprot:COSAG01_NODE_2540_length_7478_cov_13.257759_5_plen_654_part_00
MLRATAPVPAPALHGIAAWDVATFAGWLAADLELPALGQLATKLKIDGATAQLMEKCDWTQKGAHGVESARVVAAVKKLQGGSGGLLSIPGGISEAVPPSPGRTHHTGPEAGGVGSQPETQVKRSYERVRHKKGCGKKAGPFRSIPMEQRQYDFFINHCQESGQDQCGKLALLMRERGWEVWLDMSATNLTEQGMEEGVANSRNVLIFLSDGLMSRPFCQKEQRWGILYGCNFVGVAEHDDRHGGGKNAEGVDLFTREKAAAPEDLKHLFDQVEFAPYQRRDYLVEAMVTQIGKHGGCCMDASPLPGSPPLARSPLESGSPSPRGLHSPRGLQSPRDAVVQLLTPRKRARDQWRRAGRKTIVTNHAVAAFRHSLTSPNEVSLSRQGSRSEEIRFDAVISGSEGKEVKVKARSDETLPIHLRATQRARWKVFIAKRDIAVSVHFYPCPGETDDGEPTLKTSTEGEEVLGQKIVGNLKQKRSEGTIGGVYEAPVNGQLVVTLHNSYSTMRGKLVRYVLEHIDSDEQVERMSRVKRTYSDFCAEEPEPEPEPEQELRAESVPKLVLHVRSDDEQLISLETVRTCHIAATSADQLKVALRDELQLQHEIDVTILDDDFGEYLLLSDMHIEELEGEACVKISRAQNLRTSLQGSRILA